MNRASLSALCVTVKDVSLTRVKVGTFTQPVAEGVAAVMSATVAKGLELEGEAALVIAPFSVAVTCRSLLEA